MAEEIRITGFSKSALEQIEFYLGKSVGSTREKIASLGGTSLNNESFKDEIGSLEEKIEKYKQLLNTSIEAYKNAGDSLSRHTAGAFMNELKDNLGVLQLQLSILKEQKEILDKNKDEQEGITNEVEKTILSLQEQAKQEKDIAKYRDIRYKIEKKQREEWFNDKENKLKKLDELEDSLFKRRQLKNQRQRERSLELEEKSTDEKGRTKLNKEWLEYVNKFKEINQDNTKARSSAIAISKVSEKMNKGINFLSSDKKVSISEIGSKIADVAGKFGPIGKAIGGIAQLITAVLEAYDKINAASSKYARSVGGGLEKMRQMKADSVQVASDITKLGENAYKFEEILQHITELSEKTGRVMDHMSQQDIKSLEDLSRAGITSDILNQYDSFGLSIERIDERITDIYKTSGKHGLNAKAVTDAVNKNLKIAQSYTFAGGQRALERMAEKSVALKYNMEAVSRFADKVSTLEGAATAGAHLSVLGGDFARMGNPLSMLYGGLQDAEKLNDMMLNMTKNMAYWDNENKEIRISAYNKQRLRAAADAMGVSYDDLINQSMTQGKRNRIDQQLDSTGKIKDEDTREYIRNLAQLDENGKAYIRFSGDENVTYLDKLDESQKERLKQESESMSVKEAAKIGDVYMQTRTITDKINDFIQFFKNEFFKIILKIAGYDEEDIKVANDNGIYDMEGIQEITKARRAGRWIGATTGAAAGLAAGAAVSGWGAIPGMIIGGVSGYIGGGRIGNAISPAEKRARELAINRKREELTKQYTDSSGNIDNSKVDKKLEEWYNQTYGEPKKLKNGGSPFFGGEIRGKGTSKSDSIPAMLSNGEFVMNEKATKKHLPTLSIWNSEGLAGGTTTPIRAGNNQTNPLSVTPHLANGSSSFGSRFGQIPPLSVEPIKIDISGTINLTGGGVSKTILAKELLDDNTFLGQLKNKLQWYTNYALDKNLSSLKYPIAMV